jgi:hypothetical protein
LGWDDWPDVDEEVYGYTREDIEDEMVDMAFKLLWKELKK